MVLSSVSCLRLPVCRVALMAPAIDDNCLTREFKAVTAKADAISVLASKRDEVLLVCFPLGNLFAGIIAAGPPWWRAALEFCGPAKPWPKNFKPPFKIPDEWKFQYEKYLQIDCPPHPDLLLPVDLPPQGSPQLSGVGRQEAFSSAFASTRFR